MNHGQSHFHLIRDILFFSQKKHGIWISMIPLFTQAFLRSFATAKFTSSTHHFFSWLTVVRPATFIFITSGKKDNPIPIQHHQKSVRDPCFLHPSVHYCLDFPYKMQNYTHHECQSVEVHHIRLPDSSTPDYTG